MVNATRRELLTTTAASSSGPHQLGLRIVLSVLVCTLLFAAIISAFQIYRAYQQALGETRQRVAVIEKNYLPLLAAAMWSVDEPRINAVVESLAKLPDIGRVELRDDVNNLWQKQHPEFNTPLYSRSFPLSYEDNGETFLLGQLQLDVIDNQIKTSLTKTATSIAITTVSSLLLSAIFVLFIIHWWISRHLEKMANYAQHLDLGNLEQPLLLDRPNNRRPDELDVVVEAINQMRLRIKDDLGKRNDLMSELSRHREHLEALVDERTRALQQKTHLLEQQSSELQEQNHELDAYAHTVAHDLKQPLTNMVASASLLSAVGIGINLSEEKKRELLLGLQKSAQKMKAIIDSLLLLANVRKTTQIKLIPLNLRSIADESCHRLQSLIETQQAQLSFAGDWPTVLGQEQWVEEVWVNYLSNALKYGGEKPQIELGATATPNGMVKCWVKDFGPGLSEHQQQQLFDLFVRFDGHSAEGHGLGLSIVKRITRALGGEVGYEKSADGGSVFWFSLPGVN